MLGQNNVKKEVKKAETGTEKALPWQRTYSMKPSIAKEDKRVITLAKASDKLFGSKNAIRFLNEGNNTEVITAIENFSLEVAGAYLVGDLVENLVQKVSQYDDLIAAEENEKAKADLIKAKNQAFSELKNQAEAMTKFLEANATKPAKK